MKKLLLLLLIAVVGAGIAVGANAVFFSPASDDRPAMEPRGLVDEIATDDITDDATPEPSDSPKPTPEPVAVGDSTDGGSSSGAAPVPAPADDDGPRTPRSPSNGEAGPQATSFVVQGVTDEQDPPDDPCDLEESERDQQRCENEADREEDERDQDERDDDSTSGRD